MMTVSKDVLKANVVHYFERVEKTGEELVVTDNHVAVLKIVPLAAGKLGPEDVFADVRGRIKYHEDLLQPTIKEWDGV